MDWLRRWSPVIVAMATIGGLLMGAAPWAKRADVQAAVQTHADTEKKERVKAEDELKEAIKEVRDDVKSILRLMVRGRR